jgi:hypothetical protein
VVIAKPIFTISYIFPSFNISSNVLAWKSSVLAYGKSIDFIFLAYSINSGIKSKPTISTF